MVNDVEEFAYEVGQVMGLISGTCAVINSREYDANRVVEIVVSPLGKRQLAPDSFMRAGKKFEMPCHGTRSATGRNYIVAYISTNSHTELMVKSRGDGSVLVEVRTKK